MITRRESYGSHPKRERERERDRERDRDVVLVGRLGKRWETDKRCLFPCVVVCTIASNNIVCIIQGERERREIVGGRTKQKSIV